MTARDAKSGTLLLVAAFRWEVLPLLRMQQGAKRLARDRFCFQLNGRPVVLAVSGAGAENAYQTTRDLVESFQPEGVFSIGFAGGLQDALHAGDLFVADEVIEELTGQRYACRKGLLPLSAAGGSLLSARAVAASSASKEALARRWGAVAVDMESAGVARASNETGVPFGALKAITDALDHSLAIDFQRCWSDDGKLSTWKILREGLKSREGLKDLWKLAGISRLAAGRLAMAVGSV
jgi:adenosylhomocysteine nucleosidase